MISNEKKKAGGEVMDIGSMGRRQLAYTIDDHSEGLYLLAHFMHPPEGLAGLRDSLKMNAAVIRSLIVRHKPRPEIEMIDDSPMESEVEMPEEKRPAEPVTGDSEFGINSATEPVSYESIALENDINLETLPIEDDSAEGLKEV
jgi:ribosomal protein S6